MEVDLEVCCTVRIYHSLAFPLLRTSIVSLSNPTQPPLPFLIQYIVSPPFGLKLPDHSNRMAAVHLVHEQVAVTTASGYKVYRRATRFGSSFHPHVRIVPRDARPASFLLCLMAAALRRASNATAAAATTGDLRRVDGSVFEGHRCGLRRRAGETRGVLGSEGGLGEGRGAFRRPR